MSNGFPDFQSRKAVRREHYQRFVHGWRLVRCVACNGSGRYDAKGSPPCSACEGTGKVRVAPAALEWFEKGRSKQ